MVQSANAIERRQAVMSDAAVVVEWLNEIKGAPRNRILEIHRQLRAMQDGFAGLRQMRATSPVEITMKRLRQIRATSPEKTAMEAKALPSPDAAWTARYARAYRQLRKQTNLLNKFLTRYPFFPGVGLVVITETHAAGLIPAVTSRSLRLEIGEWQLTESDAALSAVRLFVNSELDRVQLCAECGQRWFVRSKKNFRFCCAEHRERFYANADDYLARKAATQKRYRANQKRRTQFS